jgi:hypothetical protein
LYNVGTAIIQGMWNGIAARWAQMVTWISDQANRLPDFIKDPLGIGSPSRVFAGLGADTAEGFFLGFRREWRSLAGDVGAAARGLATPAPVAAPMAAGRAVYAGGIVINISGAGNPDAVAEKVYRQLDAAFDRLNLESRR